MLEHLKTFGKTHLFYIILGLVCFVAFHSWLAEHDARLVADQQVKISEQQVKDLQNQIAQVQAAAAAKVQVVVKQVEAIKTPEQAIAAIPDLSSIPLHPVPAAPGMVTVEAIPLAQELGQCKVDRINLGACQETSKLKDQQLAEKDKEITALKKKPGFWARVKTAGKWILIGAAIGRGVKP